MSIMLGFLFARGLAKVTVEISDKTMTISGSGVLMNQEFDEEYEKLNNIPNIETLKIKGSIYNIDASTFSNRKQYPQLYTVETIELENIETLVDNVFHSSFNNIKTVKLGSKIRYIGENFMGSPSQIDLDIPATVEKIHPRLLRWIKSFKLQPNNKYYSVCDEKDTQVLLYANKEAIYGIADTSKPIDLVIPDCITTLDVINQEYDPSSNYMIIINSIDFNKVTTVRSNAFMMCRVNDPSNFKLDLKNIKVLEEYSLHNFNQISSIEIPASMEKIAIGNLPFTSEITINKDNKNFKIKEVGKFKFVTDINEKRYMYLNPIKDGKDEPFDFEISSTETIYNELFLGKQLNFKTVKLDCKIIYRYAFTKNTIQHLIIGPNVEEIQNNAFEECNIGAGEFNMKSIRIIDTSAFENGVATNPEGKAWLDLSLYCNVSYRTFANCLGIKSIKIYSENITIAESSFSGCSNLESVTNAEGGYIGLIDMNAFDSCASLKKLELTDNLMTIYNNYFINDELFDEYGILYAGSNAALVKPAEGLNEIKINAKSLLPYAFFRFEAKDATITFTNIEELRECSFYNAVVKKLVFGSSLKRIGYESLHVSAETIIFEGNYVEMSRANSLSVQNINLPAEVKYIETQPINFGKILTPKLKFNENNYEFTQEKVNGKDVNYITLIDPEYKTNYLRLTSDTYCLRVARTVKYIGHSGLPDTLFISVEFEEGIETLLANCNSMITLPNSLKTIAYYGSKDSIKLNDKFIWDGEFLLTKDKKTLCGITPDGDLANIPNVEVFGPYSLSSIGQHSTRDLKVPKDTLKIMEGSISYGIKTFLNDKIEEIEQVTGEFDHFPASLKKIHIEAVLSLNGKVDKGSKIFSLENNVWYLNDYYFEDIKKKVKIGVSVDNTDIEKLYLDCDITAFKLYKRVNKETLKEVELSSRFVNSAMNGVNLNGFENLNKFNPPVCEFYYFNTAVKDNLTLTGSYRYDYISGQREYVGAEINSESIPAGVLHIFVHAPMYHSAGKLAHWPWIHVPKNLNLTPKNFNYMPIIYDQEDFVMPPDPESNQGGSGLSGGEIAGIVIGVIIGVALIAFAVYWFVFRNKGDKKESSSSSDKNSA